MADFDVVVFSGAALRRWTDPASNAGQPSRVRSYPGRPPLYYLGKNRSLVVLKAVVGGVTAPADGALGGRLFEPFLTEGFGPPFFSATAGFTSIVTWEPTSPGHHVVGIRRPSGGAMLVHFDIEI